MCWASSGSALNSTCIWGVQSGQCACPGEQRSVYREPSLRRVLQDILRGFDHRVDPCSGRKRPYTIGGHADVEVTQRMYPYLTSPMQEPRAGMDLPSLPMDAPHSCPSRRPRVEDS